VMFYELLSQAMARQEGRGIRLLGISVGLAESKDTLQPIMARETKQLDLVF